MWTTFLSRVGQIQYFPPAPQPLTFLSPRTGHQDSPLSTGHVYAHFPSSFCPLFCSRMFRCGIDYTRCRWIMPLLLFFAVIFDLIAVAAQSGWCHDASDTHYTSMWDECRGRDDNWQCKSLMENSWAKATAALMIIGLIILIVAFIVSMVAMCPVRDSSGTSFIVVGVLLFIVVILQFIGLIIYPVNFNKKIFEGEYDYTWAYGFGWGATIICLGCSFIFCCLQSCVNDISGDEKIKYIYSSQN